MRHQNNFKLIRKVEKFEIIDNKLKILKNILDNV